MSRHRIDSITQLKERVTYQYRRTHRAVLKLELKQHQTPTPEQNDELQELRGFLRGLKKAVDMIEVFQNSNQLPMFAENSP